MDRREILKSTRGGSNMTELERELMGHIENTLEELDKESKIGCRYLEYRRGEINGEGFPFNIPEMRYENVLSPRYILLLRTWWYFIEKAEENILSELKETVDINRSLEDEIDENYLKAERILEILQTRPYWIFKSKNWKNSYARVETSSIKTIRIRDNNNCEIQSETFSAILPIARILGTYEQNIEKTINSIDLEL